MRLDPIKPGCAAAANTIWAGEQLCRLGDNDYHIPILIFI